MAVTTTAIDFRVIISHELTRSRAVPPERLKSSYLPGTPLTPRERPGRTIGAPVGLTERQAYLG